jgi:hypothetical protein
VTSQSNSIDVTTAVTLNILTVELDLTTKAGFQHGMLTAYVITSINIQHSAFHCAYLPSSILLHLSTAHRPQQQPAQHWHKTHSRSALLPALQGCLYYFSHRNTSQTLISTS